MLAARDSLPASGEDHQLVLLRALRPGRARHRRPGRSPSHGCTSSSARWRLRRCGYSNFSHHVGGYLGHRLVERCPPEAGGRQRRGAHVRHQLLVQQHVRAIQIDHALAVMPAFYAVQAPLTARHRRRLAQLFPIWETRNGSRAKELNLPAFVYIETHGGTPIGGSDDHAGIDIGRTFTETPRAATPEEFLAHIRAGRAVAHGAQGSAAKWTHAAMGLAIRALGCGQGAARPDPGSVLKIVERVMREGDVRHGGVASDLGPENARALLRAWLMAMDLDIDEAVLLEMLQEGELSHPDLYRRARRIHERKLASAVDEIVRMTEGEGTLDVARGAFELFDASIPAIPFAAASAFLGREKFKLTRSDGDRPRVALVADGLGGMHGVTHTIQQIRDRGVLGYEVDVIGTDADVDRRLSAVAQRLAQLGISGEAIARWDRGVDLDRFDPALRDPGSLPGEINVLYAGRLTAEKGVDLLADAFLAARWRDPRLHLVLAGGGPEQERLRERLGEHATFLGWLSGAALARAYASADAFLFASRTDTFGQVILEAQASGLPVVAVAEGGPVSLIESGETGLLAPADADALANRLLSLVTGPLLAERIQRAALVSVRGRTWEASIEQLAAGYGAALRETAPARGRQVA